MMDKKNIFIGVAWPYVNGDLHPGHMAGNFLPADIFARWQRLLGNKVLMVSGSDCFGTPITVEADKRNLSPREIVDEYHPNHLRLFKLYGISFDLYTQTTTPNHQEVVQELFLKLAGNGYILKKKTRQYYSPEKDQFLPDRYVEGVCSYCGFKEARGDQCENCGRVLDYSELKQPVDKLTGKPVVLKDTEHLFLDWPKLAPVLEAYVESHKAHWKDWIYKEASGWLKKGLIPRAITRDINWGVAIPNDRLPPKLKLDNVQNKRIYVWFEAVVGYLSAALEWDRNGGSAWRQFWYPKDKKSVVMYNFMGKDNVVFHALFWPGQLYGAEGDKIKLPDIISANQYLNLEGKKFSKSRGITIDSLYLGQTYGVDPVRFYLTYIMPENSDADFSWSDFVAFNNNVLINTFGNLVNRVLKLAEPLAFEFELLVDDEVREKVGSLVRKAEGALAGCRFKEYAQTILELADFGNKFIDRESPWKLPKTSENYPTVVGNGMMIVLALQFLVKPLVPGTADKLAGLIGYGFDIWPKGEIIGVLKDALIRVKVEKATPLFTRIEPEIIDVERAKLNL